MLYRVTIKTTQSLQPGHGTTFWQSEVAYCGPDVEQARIVYHTQEPQDYSGSHGNRARQTTFECLDTSDLADDEVGADWQTVEV